MLWRGSTTARIHHNPNTTTSTTASLRAARLLLLRQPLPPSPFAFARRSTTAAAASSSAMAAPTEEHPHEHLLRLGACGRVAPDRYDDQLALKLERLRALFASSSSGGNDNGNNNTDPSTAPVPIPERIQVFRSEPTHYRMRAEFQVWLERKPREEREAAAAKAAAANGNGNGAPAKTDEEDDGVTDLYFIMHERVPVPAEQEPAKESESEEDDKEPAKDAAAEDSRPGKRRRRSFRRRRSDRAPTSAPAGLGAGSDQQQAPQKFKMQRVRIDDFPAGSKLINSLMRLLRELLLAREPLRRRLFQVNFHTTLSGQAMVTLVYHRALDATWEEEAKKGRDWLMSRLAEEAAAAEGAAPSAAAAPACTALHLIGRCRGKRIDIDQNWVEEEMEVRPLPFGEEEQQGAGAGAAATTTTAPATTDTQRVSYRQVEMSFSQPNAGMCRQMLGWALDVTRPPVTNDDANAKNDHDLLELYCGNGNFSVPLAANFRRVLATEVSSTSVDAARHNAYKNGVGPPPPPPATADGFDGQPEATDPPARLFVARLSAEEFSETWRTGASRRRLEGLGGGGLGAMDLKTVLVDPPRAGLDDLTRALLLDPRFKRCVYVSCNPVTLKRDLALLTSAEGVERAWAAMMTGGGGSEAGKEGETKEEDGAVEAAAPAAAPAAPAPPPPKPYRIERFAAFDQFPYTEHLECGAYLVRDD